MMMDWKKMTVVSVFFVLTVFEPCESEMLDDLIKQNLQNLKKIQLLHKQQINSKSYTDISYTGNTQRFVDL